MATRVTVAVVASAVLLVGASACTRDKASQGSFCEELRQVPTLASVISGFADQDLSQLESRLDETMDQFEDLRASAPDEIGSDVDRTVDLVEAVVEAVRANHSDPDAAAAQVRAVVADHPEAETSSRAVTDYAREQCRIELNPTVPADETTDETVDRPGA